MTRINYTARAKRFGTLTSIHCNWCRNQNLYNPRIMGASKHAVPADKVLDKPFFGVEIKEYNASSPYSGQGSLLGDRPKDIAFQKAVYKAMIAHNRDVHPQNIATMISLGWIKK
jgi:hypothetical protein